MWIEGNACRGFAETAGVGLLILAGERAVTLPHARVRARESIGESTIAASRRREPPPSRDVGRIRRATSPAQLPPRNNLSNAVCPMT